MRAFRYGLMLVLPILAVAQSAFANDHDNIDAGRPLRFDDAESIGLRERSFEFGVSPNWMRSRSTTGFAAEYLYGYALNSHLTVDFDADNTHIGRGGLGIFHNLQRETLRQPALALRFDLSLPTGTDSDNGNNKGTDFRFRAIYSRTLRGSERIHLNLDAVYRTSAESGRRNFLPSVTLGYTKPLGYPKRFDRTLLAEVGLRPDERNGKGGIVSVGLGIRQQVTPRSVADIGLQSDIVAPSGALRENLRMVVGLSTSF